KFLHHVKICWLLLAASVEVSIIIGERQPVPDRVARLHLTDCAPPCWIGIVPGVTTLKDANARVIVVYGKSVTFIYHGALVEDKNRDQLMSVEFYPATDDDDIVGAIRLKYSQDGESVSVADVFTIVDPPENVYIGINSDRFTVITKFLSLREKGVSVDFF